MRVEKYHLKTESTFTRFEFVSEGPKGAIRKLIEFQETTNSQIFNLAFGDYDPQTKEINDLAVSDNGDTEKILGTVVSALYVFLNEFPDVYVYAAGSTKARTRLYRMGITKFYEQMKNDFYLYGQIGDEFPDFEIGIDYEGFLAQRKFKKKEL
ncbi:hypothetical protein Q73A0000_01725 [Kaistella flava (ex Peng et al. 2021)]|uniref:Uncharacterized protein n=1 Tax=Kaistella flava (ex Peng et al. 2021) TaxID=2038776 RepID=A0A7M2Y4W7_9FLAO|nr:hypothetical protein [Kaistella flava (ex Peng et al. 2021)]QOW09160.1 hypothetical protein Q73A0000_01725 [Kaistella flava (ex Peng et al. 2021)]